MIAWRDRWAELARSATGAAAVGWATCLVGALGAAPKPCGGLAPDIFGHVFDLGAEGVALGAQVTDVVAEGDDEEVDLAITGLCVGTEAVEFEHGFAVAP